MQENLKETLTECRHGMTSLGVWWLGKDTGLDVSPGFTFH